MRPTRARHTYNITLAVSEACYIIMRTEYTLHYVLRPPPVINLGFNVYACSYYIAVFLMYVTTPF